MPCRQFVRIAAGLLLLASGTAAAQPLAVDDSDGPPAYTETGSWTTTGNTGAGYEGTLYRFTNSNREPSTATWRPSIPEEAAYEAFAIFRRGGDRTSRAPYTIEHANGTTVVEIDQTGPFAGDLEMASLGAYRFLEGTEGSITLSNDGGSGVYIADAVLLFPDTPPEVAGVRWGPIYPKETDEVIVSASVVDNGAVDSVTIHYAVEPGGASGQAGALPAGDSDYTGAIPPQPDGATVTFTVEAVDSLGSSGTSPEYSYTVGAEGEWTVVINELMASNSFTVTDPDFGEAGDWVELYNFGPDTADLSGLGFSDRIDNPTKWHFPAGITIPPGEYILVWCDNQDFVGEAIHTSFALSAGGEDVILYDPETELTLDAISWTDLPTDVSLARFPNLTGVFEETTIPTPGGPNLFGERAAPPTISHESGLYSEPLSVTISAGEGATIRYTTDGAIPDGNSSVYAEPVAITSTTGLRARVFEEGKEPSITASASYFYTDIPDRAIPVINIVVDPEDLFHPSTGIYTNFNERGREWEREAHVSIFSPDGSIRESIDAGLRIHGGFSRSAPKKSLRLYFRNDYGQDSWSLPWLERTPAGAVRHLVLRAGGNDGFLVTQLAQLREVTFLRDQLLRDWYHEQGHFASDGFFAAVYLNGEYWGLYNPVERITDSQMDAVFGGGEDYDVVKGGWDFQQKYFTEANDGDMEAWEEFLAWHAASDVTTPEDFAGLKERMDYRNFLDFFALNIFAQNEDWPHNNWVATRHRSEPEARWIFHEWDAEWALGLRPQGWTSDSLQWARGANFHLSPSHNGTLAPLSALFSGNHLDPNRTHVINGILDRPDGRRDFIAATENVMNFELVPEKAIAQFDAYTDAISTEVPREAARWASSTNLANASTLIGYWEDGSARLRVFLQNRPAYMRSLIQSTFSLAGHRAITFEAAGEGAGHLLVRGRAVELPWTGYFFDGSGIELTAVASDGSLFTGWSGHFQGGVEETTHMATAGPPATVILNFDEEVTPGDIWLMF